MMRTTNSIAMSIVMTAAFAPGAATAFELDAFGHAVWLKGAYPEMALLIDDQLVLAGAILTIDSIQVIAGTPVLIGYSSGGGNACEAAPFVLSFPTNGAAKTDGPLETCALTKMVVDEGSLRFEAKALVGREAEVWTWTPVAGFREDASVIEMLDPERGWDDLRERLVKNPADLLSYGEIADQMVGLLGAETENFTTILGGVGSGHFKGDDYVGVTCASHQCGSVEAFIYLFTREKRVFLAWKPSDEVVKVRPLVSEWPEAARNELKSWARKWQ